MGRPRKPTALLELTGALDKNPQRRRDNEPKPAGPLGPPPKHFDEELAEIWNELSAMCPARVLTVADRWLVELACRTMQQVRNGSALAAERNLLLSCLSRMGLTPADRSKIGIPQTEDEPDELARLAAETRPTRPN